MVDSATMSVSEWMRVYVLLYIVHDCICVVVSSVRLYSLQVRSRSADVAIVSFWLLVKPPLATARVASCNRPVHGVCKKTTGQPTGCRPHLWAPPAAGWSARVPLST